MADYLSSGAGTAATASVRGPVKRLSETRGVRSLGFFLWFCLVLPGFVIFWRCFWELSRVFDFVLFELRWVDFYTGLGHLWEYLQGDMLLVESYCGSMVEAFFGVKFEPRQRFLKQQVFATLT